MLQFSDIFQTVSHLVRDDLDPSKDCDACGVLLEPFIMACALDAGSLTFSVPTTQFCYGI
jgi:hypothetical protein